MVVPEASQSRLQRSQLCHDDIVLPNLYQKLISLDWVKYGAPPHVESGLVASWYLLVLQELVVLGEAPELWDWDSLPAFST